MRFKGDLLFVAAAMLTAGCTTDVTLGGGSSGHDGSVGGGSGNRGGAVSTASGGVVGTGGRSESGGAFGTGGGLGSGGSPDAGVVGADGSLGGDGKNGTAGGLGTDGAAENGGRSGTGGSAEAGVARADGSLSAGGKGGGAGSLGGAVGMGGRSGTGGSADASVTEADGSLRPDGKGGAAGSLSTGGAAGIGGRSGTGGSGDAGVAGASGQAGIDGGAGQGGTGGLGPQAPGGQVTGYGFVELAANSKNQVVRLQTTLTVPAKPPASGTLFLWPGLQPGGANYLPIDNGVLQPVLTWGRSCAPGTQPAAYSTWWISAQYVNTYGKNPGYTGCSGGPVMSVNVGDALAIDMQLAGQVWNQTVTDEQTGQSVTFSKDMLGQAQNHAYFDIEGYSSAPVSEVVFTNTTLTFGSADAADCRLSRRGQTDFVSVPQPSSDGLQCSVQEITLRAQGIH